jgi:hypothetical protein
VISSSPKKILLIDVEEKESRRVEGNHEEKNLSTRNKPLTFMDVIKKDSYIKKKNIFKRPPLLLTEMLDLIDEVEEENEMDWLIKGENIPLKDLLKKRTKGLKYHEELLSQVGAGGFVKGRKNFPRKKEVDSIHSIMYLLDDEIYLNCQ